MNETEKVLNANLAEIMNSAIVERDETIKQLRAEVERLSERLTDTAGALARVMIERDQWRECAERLARCMKDYRLNVDCDAPTEYSEALAAYEQLKGMK